jgi:glutathione S-transferase
MPDSKNSDLFARTSVCSEFLKQNRGAKMTLTLFVGDYTYSSWSLRGWLLMDPFEIPRSLRRATMRTADFDALIEEIAPSNTVPALRLPNGQIVWDTIAIAETLHELHPDAGIWPSDQGARAMARSLVATMHSSFSALRSACPMNMARAYRDFVPGDDVLEDVSSITDLWSRARAHSGRSDGPFLFGTFSAADAFFAPVASRIVTYGLPVTGADADYVAALIGHPSVRRWRAMGRAQKEHQAHYELDLQDRPNSHDTAIIGRIIPGNASENSLCPYSGEPVAEDCLVEMTDPQGRTRVIGYCNPFCAAKTAADPMAWPATVDLLT